MFTTPSPKPCTDMASNLIVIGLQNDVRITCDCLQQKFQHAEYFTCNHVKLSQFSSDLQTVFTIFLDFHMLSFDTAYMMMRQLFLLDENCHCKYNVASKLLQVDHCKYGMSDVARAVVALRNCSQHPAMSRSQPKIPNYSQRVSGA